MEDKVISGVSAPLPLSVVIITVNEADRIERCLSSLPSGVEIIVLDSGSEDETCNIARKFGAIVGFHKFKDFSSQKNAAIAMASRPWILSIDADEVLTQDLVLGILGAITNPHLTTFRLRRQLVFMGKVMRFGKAIDWPIRLFLRGSVDYTNPIHEKLEIKGQVGRISRGRLMHYSYRNFEDYFNRFNRYTTLIAKNHFTRGDSLSKFYVFRFFFEFFYRYILRLGFLDGYPGYVYALFSSFYAYVKYLKLKELMVKDYGS